MTWMRKQEEKVRRSWQGWGERRGEKDIYGWALSNRRLISDTVDSVVPRMDRQQRNGRHALFRRPLGGWGHACLGVQHPCRPLSLCLK